MKVRVYWSDEDIDPVDEGLPDYVDIDENGLDMKHYDSMIESICDKIAQDYDWIVESIEIIDEE